MAYASEHRCSKDGKWKPGPARSCPDCGKKVFKVGQYIQPSTTRL